MLVLIIGLNECGSSKEPALSELQWNAIETSIIKRSNVESVCPICMEGEVHVGNFWLVLYVKGSSTETKFCLVVLIFSIELVCHPLKSL